MEAETEKATGSRVLLLAAVLALAVVAAVGFGRIFRGPAPTLKLAVAAGAAVLLAGLTERRHVLLDILVSSAGLLLAVSSLILPQTTRYGVPTAETLRAIATAWGAVGRTAEAEVAPALPLVPLMLASVIAVWAASSSAHALAVRAASPFLALLPTGALIGFASLVLGEGPRPLYVVAFLLAALFVLFADSLRRVGQWGPLATRQGGRRFGAMTTFRSARRVALGSLLVALLLPGILPGFGSPGLVETQGEGAIQRISVNPIVDIRPSLLRSPDIRVFTVESERPAYWRFLSLDRFNGQLWAASDPYAEEGAEVSGGALPPPGEAFAPTGQGIFLDQRFEFDRLAQSWLPAAYQPVEIAAGDLRPRYDPRSETLVAPDGIFPGMSYTVRSYLPTPTPEDLDATQRLDFRGADRYLQLPSDLPPRIGEIAREITAGESTPYRQVLAIQQYLRRFRYSTSVEAGHDADHIVRFLTVTKAGYCEQFAGTMAVLLRTLGIPARVAIGFTSGVRNFDTGTWEVNISDAHAWVEVPFPGHGWLAFEPTPSRANPSAGSYQAPLLEPGSLAGPECVLRAGGRGPEPCRAEGRTPAAQPPNLGGALSPEAERGFGEGDAMVPPAPLPRTWWDRNRAWVGAGALLVLLALMIPVVKAARRRAALRLAREGRDVVLAAYRVFEEHAADLGMARRPNETLWEYRRRLKQLVPALDGHLDTLTGVAGRAAYSGAPLPAGAGEEAKRTARRVMTDLNRTAGPTRRMVGLFRVPLPPSLRR